MNKERLPEPQPIGDMKLIVPTVSPAIGNTTVMGSTASIGEIEGINRVHHLNFLNNMLPDKCANLIIADPPYFEVKGDFDFIWKDFKAYLEDVYKWAAECKRLLADNGTLFWYGDAKKIAYSQVILDEMFMLLNSMVWRKKDSIQYQYYSPDLARTFNTHNERILMYSREHEFMGLTPFAEYLRKEFESANVTNREIAKLFPSFTGGLTGCVSNWVNGDNVITEEQYLKIRDHLKGEYLQKDYSKLKDQYENQRRHFDNVMKLEEVLEFSQEAHITKEYDHPTKKPETLTRALIQVCSRKNDLVIVPFAGSGTEMAMSIKEGRRAIGFEITEKHVHMSNKRVLEILRKPELFR